MEHHNTNHLLEIGAVLQAVSSKRILPSSFATAAPVKRSRFALLPLGGKFIDAYATSYKSLSKNPAARENLIKTILTAYDRRVRRSTL